MSEADDILATFEARRRELGLSQAEVSLRAFGKPTSSAFQNIRKGSAPSIDRVRALCEALDLEFYVGPRRDITPTGFAEATVASFTRAGATAACTDVFREGFLPFPWHDRARQPTPPPVAISLAWLQAHGLAPNDLRFVELPDHPDGPTLALVDSRARRAGDPATWCWIEAGRLHLGTLYFDEGGPVVIGPSPAHPKGRWILPKDVFAVQFLGRAVWVARLEPAEQRPE